MSLTPNNRDSRAPEGAHCAEHPDRPALFTCPRCGSYACVVCFHPAIERCQQCLARDPTEAAPPLAWERPEQPPLTRYVQTLASAFSPVRSAPAFARDETAPARRFLLLTALPFALLAGVIPHTRTLLFEGGFKLRLLGQPAPDGPAIALDVVRAMGLQLGLSLIECACIALPFVSLCRAYAPARTYAALRLMYYRLWLLPGSLLAAYLLLFALPGPVPGSSEPPPVLLGLLLFSVRTLLPVLLFVAMGSTARIACGLGPWLSMVVVIVPVLLSLAVKQVVDETAMRLLPQMPPIAQADANR